MYWIPTGTHSKWFIRVDRSRQPLSKMAAWLPGNRPVFSDPHTPGRYSLEWRLQAIARFQPNSARNTRGLWGQGDCISLIGLVVQGKSGAFQLGINPRCARISSRSSSRSALLFLRRLKNSSSTLTTIALTLTPSASAHSLSLSRASAPTWRS